MYAYGWVTLLDALLLVKEDKAVVCSASVSQEHYAVCALPRSSTSLLPGTVLAALLLLTLSWKMVKAEALATDWR